MLTDVLVTWLVAIIIGLIALAALVWILQQDARETEEEWWDQLSRP